jgi:hypothetical protein
MSITNELKVLVILNKCEKIYKFIELPSRLATDDLTIACGDWFS